MKTIKWFLMIFATVSYYGIAQNNTWTDIYGKDFNGPDGYISSISAGKMGLFVGGGFSRISGNTTLEVPAYNVTQWKDTSWIGVGSGAENGARPLVRGLLHARQSRPRAHSGSLSLSGLAPREGGLCSRAGASLKSAFAGWGSG